jgi:hypothetical protein
MDLCRRPLPELTPGWLEELAHELGGLAPWWLRDEVLERLAEEMPAYRCLRRPWRPVLPDSPGSCWILYACPRGHLPLFRPAFLLPLRWRQGPDHSAALPANVRALAEQIVRQVDRPGWALDLSPQDGIDCLDLRAVDFDCGSGWAALAGGLLTLLDGGRPRPDVWATAAWDSDGGVAWVGELAAKFNWARHCGVRSLFIPQVQVSELPAAEGCEIQGLPAGLRSPRETLRDYLIVLDVPPDTNAPRQQRAAYYLRHPVEHPLIVSYYQDHLLGEIIARCQDQLAADWPGWRPTHLVTIVSGSPDLVVLSARVLAVADCLLLHTKQYAASAAEAAEALRGFGVTPLLARFDDNDRMAGDMHRQVSRFAPPGTEGNLVFDLTPGTKLMTLTLERLARQHWRRGWLIYLRHQMDHRRQVPFTEKLERWQASPDDHA